MKHPLAAQANSDPSEAVLCPQDNDLTGSSDNAAICPGLDVSESQTSSADSTSSHSVAAKNRLEKQLQNELERKPSPPTQYIKQWRNQQDGKQNSSEEWIPESQFVEDSRPIFQTASISGRRSDYVGAVIDGRYAIEALLGEGTSSLVYRARHQVLDKLVAIKVLRSNMARDAGITNRFIVEAKACSLIRHPNVIEVMDFGTLPDGAAYLVMEFLRGSPLSNYIAASAPLEAQRVLEIAWHIADGLAEAHRHRVVHRDLKPDNVFLTDGGSQRELVKILDFGIAKAPFLATAQTCEGAVFGTPYYMSPEQATGACVDHRADVYALGIIMYEMACGRLPFVGENVMCILNHHVNTTPTSLKEAIKQVFGNTPSSFGSLLDEFERVVFRCLKKDPKDRYGSMQELQDDIEQLASALGGHQFKAETETTLNLPMHPATTYEPITQVSPNNLVNRTANGTTEKLDPFEQDSQLVPAKSDSAQPDYPAALPEAWPKCEQTWPSTQSAPQEPLPALTDNTPLTIATKPHRRKYLWLVIPAGLVVVIVAMGIVMSRKQAHSGPLAAQPTTTEDAVTVIAPPEPSSEPPALQNMREVQVQTEPPLAMVSINDEPIGRSPVSIKVPVGGFVTILVKAEGYNDKMVELDSLQSSQTVTLQRMAPRPVATGSATNIQDASTPSDQRSTAPIVAPKPKTSPKLHSSTNPKQSKLDEVRDPWK